MTGNSQDMEFYEDGVEQLDAYVREQGCDHPEDAIFAGYETGPANYRRMGVCYFMHHPDTNNRIAKVYVSAFCFNCSQITHNAAFWHEAAHATQWINCGSTGHGWDWFKYYLRRPVLATLGTAFAAVEYVLRNIRR